MSNSHNMYKKIFLVTYSCPI
uniref:Uncharacterized protein n=1 Tax=Solanum lycopersicum TaxID=4081 RepID=K4B2N0_SOLLC